MVLNAVLLYLLAVADAALSGYRAVAGTNPRIKKRAFHQQAIARALLWGHVVIVLNVLGIMLLLWLFPNLLQDLIRSAQHCLEVYLLYALLTVLALLGFTMPSRDVRSISIVLILGPFTLLRAPVAVCGVLWALWHVPRAEVLLVCGMAIVPMLLLETFLWRRYKTSY